MNVLLVPKIGYWGAAWATLTCYVFMVAAGYLTEQKYYPVPYDTKRIFFYLLLAVVLFLFLKFLILPLQLSLLLTTLTACCLLAFYLFTAWYLEQKK
jgi:O-antigen/teichoic acid export membrane protein